MTWRQQDFCRIQFFAPLLYVCRYINNMHCRCSTRVVTVKGYDPSHPGLPEAFILRWSFFKISFLICCFSEKKNIAGIVMIEFINLYNLYPHHHICKASLEIVISTFLVSEVQLLHNSLLHYQCPAGRVFQYRVGYWTKYRVAGRVRVG